MNKNRTLTCLIILLCGNYAMYAKAESVVEGQAAAGQIVHVNEAESDRDEQKDIKKSARLLAAIGQDIRKGIIILAFIDAVGTSYKMSVSCTEQRLVVPTAVFGAVFGAVVGAMQGALYALPLSIYWRSAQFASRAE